MARGVESRRAADMRCRAGCADCCRVELEVCAVEAESIRRHVARQSQAARDALRVRAGERPAGSRCAMLDDAGQCAIYGVRPLVCRTQGLPLRYPQDTVPAAAVMARSSDGGEVTWCPLNFQAEPPRGEDTLDAERTDALLALVNQRWARTLGTDALERTALRDIAASSGIADQGMSSTD